MKHSLAILLLLQATLLFMGCADDDGFTTSPTHLLSFSVDSVKLDTVFSRVPSSTRTFWVYNKSGDGIRCSSVRLAQGNQTGFRVNVDGIYLGATEGFQTSEIEVRNKDSIRVFVELTAPQNGQSQPQELTDDLVFALESGAEQRMPLQAFVWDAQLLRDVHIARDTIFSDTKPMVVYGGLTVEEGATLELRGTTLYFHADAGIDVHGRLVTDAADGRETILRGDRLDRMFDYLPYDRVSGQWRGIRFFPTSANNEIRHTDIHSGMDAIVCDSAALDTIQPKLTLTHSTIHNCQGYGLLAYNAYVVVNTCQITNTLHDCVAIFGGKADIRNCTLAQFYPFDSARGAALRFANTLSDTAAPYPLYGLFSANNIITGYADDVLMGGMDSTQVFNYAFDHCLIRTPKVETADSVFFQNVIFEDAEDTTQVAKRNFELIDEDNLRYDFKLSEKSRAINTANPVYALPDDRLATKRDDQPDMGAYEYVKQ